MVMLKDIMKSEVLTITPTSSIYEAARKMASNGVSCLVVFYHDDISGIITRRDILEKAVVNRVNLDQAKVEDMMTTPVITMKPEATIAAASGIVDSKRIKQIPVLNDGKLVGIVTETDLVLNLYKMTSFDKTTME